MEVIQKSSNGVDVTSDWGMARDRIEHWPNYPWNSERLSGCPAAENPHRVSSPVLSQQQSYPACGPRESSDILRSSGGGHLLHVYSDCR